MTNIWTDGGCSGNGTANAASYGSFLVDGEPAPHRLTERTGGTNNQAEYLALITALRYAADRQIVRPHILTDSALVVNQVGGRWKVKDRTLQTLCDAAQALVVETGATLEWVSRGVIVEKLGH